MFCLFLYPAVGYCSDGRGRGGGFTLETFGKQGEGGYTSHFVPRLHFVTLATSKWILIVPLRAGPLCRTPKPQPFEKKVFPSSSFRIWFTSQSVERAVVASG